eukprot:Trichotokara_eunicae@DN5368_c0_g1_i1.p1
MDGTWISIQSCHKLSLPAAVLTIRYVSNSTASFYFFKSGTQNGHHHCINSGTDPQANYLHPQVKNVASPNVCLLTMMASFHFCCFLNLFEFCPLAVSHSRFVSPMYSALI